MIVFQFKYFIFLLVQSIKQKLHLIYLPLMDLIKTLEFSQQNLRCLLLENLVEILKKVFAVSCYIHS